MKLKLCLFLFLFFTEPMLAAEASETSIEEQINNLQEQIKVAKAKQDDPQKIAEIIDAFLNFNLKLQGANLACCSLANFSGYKGCPSTIIRSVIADDYSFFSNAYYLSAITALSHFFLLYHPRAYPIALNYVSKKLAGMLNHCFCDMLDKLELDLQRLKDTYSINF